MLSWIEDRAPYVSNLFDELEKILNRSQHNSTIKYEYLEVSGTSKYICFNYCYCLMLADSQNLF
jgi:hypothetical protein